MVREVAGSTTGKDVCVVGSGNNHAAFAFSGMGANVTSVDISERRLAVASKRARHLGLPITFVQADAADISLIGNAEFDLVFSSNGFFVWIADLQAVFGEIYRILRPGGHYVFYDIHPFQRPWKDQTMPIEVAKPYWETGPFENGEEGRFEFNWTLADILNPLTTSGLRPAANVGESGQGLKVLAGLFWTYRGLTTACWTGKRTPGQHCRYGSR